MSDLTDLIVIGGGLSGLISAYHVANTGAKVIVIESSPRLGGRLYTGDLEGNSVEMGAEWFSSSQHSHLLEELHKKSFEYSIKTRGLNSTDKSYWYMGRNKVFEQQQFLNNQIFPNVEYQRAIRILEFDVDKIVLSQGMSQPELTEFDIPFIEYIENRLQLTDEIIKDFILIQTFYFSGSEPSLQSAIGILYILRGLAGFEGSVSALLTSFSFNILKDQYMSSFITSLADDLVRLGVQILLNQCIVSIELVYNEIINYKYPNYDYPPRRNPDSIIRVKNSQGLISTTKSVIMAIPLKVLPKIKFNPPLPDSMITASYRCDISEHMKAYASCEGVSSKTDAVASWKYAGKEVRKIDNNYNNNNIDEIGRVTDKSIMSIIGLRCDLAASGHLEKSMQKLFPTLTVLNNDNRNNSNIKDSQNEKNEVKEMYHNFGFGLLYHDFLSDRNIRSSWFALRHGTSELHYRACNDAIQPWQSNESLTIIGADVSLLWPGWMEGAVYTAKRAAERIIIYLFPPKVKRNFVKLCENKSDNNNLTGHNHNIYDEDDTIYILNDDNTLRSNVSW
eukprot:gene13824-18538_t